MQKIPENSKKNPEICENSRFFVGNFWIFGGFVGFFVDFLLLEFFVDVFGFFFRGFIGFFVDFLLLGFFLEIFGFLRVFFRFFREFYWKFLQFFDFVENFRDLFGDFQFFFFEESIRLNNFVQEIIYDYSCVFCVQG